MNSSLRENGFLWSALAGIFTGFLLLKSLPLADLNLLVLAAIPVLLCVLLLTLVRVNLVLALILLSRALLDPLFDSTKVALLGDSMGLGGLLNVFIVCLCLALAIRHGKAVLGNPTVQRWLLFLLVCLISIAYSPVRGKGFKLFLYFLSYASMTAIPLCVIRDFRDERFWIKILMASCFLPVLWADLDWMRGGVYYADAGARVQGSFSHPNILAFFLVFAIMLTFYVFKSGHFRPNRGIATALKLLFMNCLLLLVVTKTRNAWIACWIFFAFYGVFREKKYLWLCLLIPPLAFLAPPIFQRLQDLLQGSGSDPETELNSFAWRVELWKRALEYGQDKLAFGHGLNSFKPLSVEFFKAGGEGVPAHNTYVQMLFETGGIGVLCYVAVAWSVLKDFFKGLRKTASGFSAQYAIAAAYVVSYAFSCAGDNLPDYIAFNWYVWFFIGILLKHSLLTHEENIRHYSLV